MISTSTSPTLPSPAQSQWMKLGYGMFLHFGPNTFNGVGWGDGKFPASGFHPRKLNPRQWAEAAAEAGMRYAILTTKHHDGFCLWPSAHTGYSVRQSPGAPDVLGAYVEAFRAAGLTPGLYYSLWDLNYPRYEDDAAYADYMKAQMTELLSQYGPICQLWFDGGWDKESPTRSWNYDEALNATVPPAQLKGERWDWPGLYAHIKSLQPDCLVLNNTSSHRPGRVRYFPTDLRSSEHFDFLYREEICEPDTRQVFPDDSGTPRFLPLEYCTSLNPDWFWIEGKFYGHPSVDTICSWYRRARAHQANLLLNVGPNKDGLIPAYHCHYLKEAARVLGSELP